jgi:hypothetical protein
MPVALVLTKMQKNFDNYEKMLLFSRLNVLNLMKLIELGNYINKLNWTVFELSFMITFPSIRASHLIKLHKKSLSKSSKKEHMLLNNIVY